jgi:hypothetical protein
MRNIAEYMEEIKLHRVVVMRRLHSTRPASQPAVVEAQSVACGTFRQEEASGNEIC